MNGNTCPASETNRSQLISYSGPKIKATYGIKLFRLRFFPIAFSFHDKDLRVVDEPVGNRCGNGCAVKNVSPSGERQICCDHGGSFFMPGADDLEEQV
jgi:hypothetical protein